MRQESLWRCVVALPALAAVGACLLALAPAARAQNLEAVLAPGKVIEGHAKYEDECNKCHVRFDRPAQDGLCMDCHKEVGADMRAKTGFHGRQKPPQACRSCHTDHRGRDAHIVVFDPKSFDHTQSDYLLRGKHEKTDCAKCHIKGKKYWEAPQDCVACHRKDDIHKNSLGPKCGDCHTESNWKEAKFDHSKTKFPLLGKHEKAKCEACHKDTKYNETPQACVACHRKEDKHKGNFGEKCGDCHTAKDWKDITFNHDTDTKYLLRGKHRTTKCEACHTGNLYKDKLKSDCYACHKKDDKHEGNLGTKCESCHTERNWKDAKFDHDKTEFPLRGKHGEVECKDCHKSLKLKEVEKTCIGCHKKDDKHEGNLGVACGDCHGDRDWKKAPKFDHDKTKFKLRNGHAEPKVKCDACHKDLKSYRDTRMDCNACHQKDDVHKGKLGLKCEQCHDDRKWKITVFDHNKTKFPLAGAHIRVECKDCHKSQEYRDTKRDCWSCHEKDDKHKRRYGKDCEPCHNVRSWAAWDFDHDRKTKYKLEGKHRKVDCEACHRQPAPPGKFIAAVGSTCISCHAGDDAHDGSFGRTCERCHVVAGWKQVTQRSAISPDGVLAADRNARLLGEASHRPAGVGTLGTLGTL